MYILIAALVIINLILLYINIDTNYFYAVEPKKSTGSSQEPTKPTKPDTSKFSAAGGYVKPPSKTLLQNAIKFFNRNPNRINNPPDAYAKLIDTGYIKKNGNSFTINSNPTGQPPVTSVKPPQTTGGSVKPPQTTGGSVKTPPTVSSQRGPKAPVTNPASSYCSAGSFGGKTTSCTSASAHVTEANLLEDGKPVPFPKTSSPIKAGYLAVGTANDFIPRDSKYYYTGPTITNTNLDNRDDKGRRQPGFDYNNTSQIPAIINTLKGRVDVIASAGGNAVRFDELDTCANGKCNQANFNKVLTAISQYAASKNMSVLGNNNSYDSGSAPSSAEAIANSGARVAGWIVEADPQTGASLRQTLGNNVPIYGLSRSSQNASSLSKAQVDGTAVFDSVAVYQY